MKRLAAVLAFTLSLSVQAAELQDGIQAFAAGDYDTAQQIFRERSDAGDARGAFWIGYLYHYGHGVKVDQVEALKWFQQSADRGDVKARQYLGIMYQKGQGAPQDLVAAHKWYTLFHRDTDNVRDRPYTREIVKKMERKMTPEQIAQAKQMADSWKPAN
ncbi:MAG: sel1 repeat family protein [Betaproteobacteria bacterium]|nr:sel1 repeat family protein [Betaproteobacteria bacterium]